jgi:hypothetical protein
VGQEPLTSHLGGSGVVFLSVPSEPEN